MASHRLAVDVGQRDNEPARLKRHDRSREIRRVETVIF
jgi:hypothetical protein